MSYFLSISQVAAFVLFFAAPIYGKLSDAEVAFINESTDPKLRTIIALEQLPSSLDDREHFIWLASLLDLKLLDKSHVRILVSSELRLERAFRQTPGTFKMTNGGKLQTWLLSGIVLRIEELLLHDNRAFRKSREKIAMGSIGFMDHFRALSEWCSKNNVEIEAAALIPQAIEDFEATPESKTHGGKPSPPTKMSVKFTKPTSWNIIVVLIVAAIAPAWWLFKRRK